MAEQQQSIYTVLFTKQLFGALKRKVKPFSAWRLTQQTQGGSKNATHRHFEKLDQQFHLLLLIKKTAEQTRTHKLKMEKEKLKPIETDSWGHHNAFPSSKKELV